MSERTDAFVEPSRTLSKGPQDGGLGRGQGHAMPRAPPMSSSHGRSRISVRCHIQHSLTSRAGHKKWI